MYRESWMRVKKAIFGSIFTLLCMAAPSLAADYNFLIINGTTENSGSNLYVNIHRQGSNDRCVSLSSYGDGSFYTRQSLNASQRPTFTFYTNRNCRGTALATISPLSDGETPVANNLIITITDLGATQVNSAETIQSPSRNPGTTNPGTTPGTEPGTDPGTNPGTNPGVTTPDNPRNPTQTKRKVIRFFAPWTNTSAIVYVAGGDSAKMTTVKNYCGWFEARIEPPTGSLQVYFKQTIGSTYVGDNVYNKINPATNSIWLSLDEVASEVDTIWVKANKAGAPNVSAKYPGILGDCPTKTLPVMMFDWLHGTKGDGDGEGKNGDPANGVSADFGSGGCGGSNARDSENRGYMKGMVEEFLGANGVPVQAALFPENCKITTHINDWFLPQVVAQKNGKEYSNATCRSIELTLEDDGLWLGKKDGSSPEGGLFLLDDFQYLDAEQTVPNPYFDNISGHNKRHNYGFTMKIQATFEYVPGQYFEFLGDDDVWVFINNRLVVDIGGQHSQVSGAVDLDTLNLVEGANYSFHIFYAERHTSSSNFMMRTSIDLKTEASLFYRQIDPGVINYNIYQIIREQALACDFSSNATTKDTVDAPSNLTLFGSGAYAEGVPLDSVGTWFGGITVKPGYTGFVVDTALIRQMRTLPPGTYQLRFSLQKDETQTDDIWFTIYQYDSPTINFARVDERNNWTLMGNEVDGTIDTLGKWVNTRYTVNIAFAEEWATFDDMVYVNTSNSALIPCDENGNRISTVTMKNGKATFYVKATAPVQDVTLIVGSSDESQTAAWRHISFMEPPVPQVVFASIFDRDGDGRGDSVYAKLTKPVGTLNSMFVKMDSVQLEFGEKFDAITEVKSNDIDSSISMIKEGGFGAVPFTGGAETVYSGKITPFWTYSEGAAPTTISLTNDLTDSIGPVITSAEISYSDDGSTILTLSFSEGLDCDDNVQCSIFTYFFRQTGQIRENEIIPDIFARDSKSKWKLIFRNSFNDKSNIPVMGDSIRMVPGVHMDLLHRSTDVRNPFIRISGEQNVVVTSAPVVTIGESDSSIAIISSKTPTVPKIVPGDQAKTAKEVASDYGAQGHYLGDLSISSMVKDEITNLQSAVKNFNAKSMEQGGKHLDQILAEVEAGTISIDKANKEYKLGDDIVNAYKNGIITSTDVTGIANGNNSVVTKVSNKLAEMTKLEYKTMYFTSLGVFVNSTSGSLSCTDELYNGNCLDNDNDGRLFLAWNMKSKSGRMVGTGVYIARLAYKIKIGRRVVVDRTQDFLWGVRHGRTKSLTIDLNP